MTTLKSIREATDSGLLLLGVIEEGEFNSYMLNIATYAEIGSPKIGDRLDESALEIIKSTDQTLRAKRKALSLLSYADNNKKNLSMKLRRAGFSYDIAKSTCENMEELGYINERSQIERLIIDQANHKLRGPRKIIPALVAKGYSMTDVREILSELIESGEVDFKKNAKLLIKKKLSDPTEEETKKLLYKNGYNI